MQGLGQSLSKETVREKEGERWGGDGGTDRRREKLANGRTLMVGITDVEGGRPPRRVRHARAEDNRLT